MIVQVRGRHDEPAGPTKRINRYRPLADAWGCGPIRAESTGDLAKFGARAIVLIDWHKNCAVHDDGTKAGRRL
jgi:hypothetical protein